MVIILIYYLLLVYQLATLTNLIEELDNASKSIDIVSNTISDTELIIFTVRRRDWGIWLSDSLSLCLVLPLLSCPYLAVPVLVSFLLVN